jgi:hypothetical protein
VIAAWRAGTGYPDPRLTSMSQWAWEFLRRNPGYRADWHRYVKRCSMLRAKYGAETIGDREPTAFAFMVHADRVATVYEPPRRRKESERAWLRRVGHGHCVHWGSWLCRKWGLLRHTPQDPTSRTFSEWWASSSALVWEVNSITSERPRAERTQLAYAFDLTRPLRPQVVQVERMLRERQKILINSGSLDRGVAHGRAQSGKIYQRYLRVLDALEDGVKAPGIAEALFPTEDTLSRTRKVHAMIVTATQLRDSGFRLLPALKDVTSRKDKARR